MRIHSDVLTHADAYAACMTRGMKGVYVDVTSHGSRKRKGAIEVKLTGTSTRRPNPGTGPRDDNDDYAATWDEWGMFLADLFAKDPKASATYYDDADDFHWKTDGRFKSLTAPYQHKNHKWEFSGVPREFHCASCEAVKRF